MNNIDKNKITTFLIVEIWWISRQVWTSLAQPWSFKIYVVRIITILTRLIILDFIDVLTNLYSKLLKYKINDYTHIIFCISITNILY